ncbi:2790_t:CDS:2, partial [Acaulospora morrowiae]
MSVTNSSQLFFSNLPSSISLDEDIKEYIANVLTDIEDFASLRDATEQFLIDAGTSDEELESFYLKLSAEWKEDEPSSSVRDLVKRLPSEMQTKVNLSTTSKSGNTSNQSNEKTTKSSPTNLTSTARTVSSSSSPLKSDDVEIVAYSQQSRFHTETLETLSKEVDLKDVNITVGHQELLVDSRLQLKTGVHYGLIGRNGVGKSTLLRCIGTRELIGFPKNVRVLYIEQLEHIDESLRVIDLVLQADEERTMLLQEKQILQQAAEGEVMDAENAVKKVMFERLKKELKDAEKLAIQRSGRRGVEARQELLDAEARVLEAKRALDEKHENQNEDYTTKLHVLLEEVYTKLDQIDADSAEPRAREILSGLGFSEKQQYSPVASLSSLSGGWRMRVTLAQSLFLQPDILLLDEPTNHLDLPAILWLQSYLNTLIDTTMVIVSHDRRFLNKTVTEIIRFKDQKLTYHTGNYDEFEKNLEDLRLKKERMYEAQEKQKKHIEI